MSYVLEALKRQEAAGDPDAAVSFARQSLERRRHRLWMGLFAAAMVINAVLLGYFFGLPWLTRAEVPQPAPIASPPAATPRESAAPPAADTTPRAADAPGPEGPASAVAAPRQTAPAPEATEALPEDPPPRPEPAPPPRLSLAELPSDARARFPGIAFSTHIYAEDQDLRAIVANGQRLEEGDLIRGLEILEITETGVVLAFEDYRVEVPIAVDW